MISPGSRVPPGPGPVRARPRRSVRRLKLLGRKLLGTRDHPERIARGVSVGLFIALTPTLGLQILLTLLACPLLRANRVVAMPMLAITNPLTIAPFLWVWYRIGLLFTGEQPLEYQRFQALLPGGDLGFLESLQGLFVAFGAPLWIGAFLTASLAAGAAYPVVLVAASRWAERRRLRSEGSSARTDRPSARCP